MNLKLTTKIQNILQFDLHVKFPYIYFLSLSKKCERSSLLKVHFLYVHLREMPVFKKSTPFATWSITEKVSYGIEMFPYV